MNDEIKKTDSELWTEKLIKQTLEEIKESNEDFFISLLNDIEEELTSYNISVSKTR